MPSGNQTEFDILGKIKMEGVDKVESADNALSRLGKTADNVSGSLGRAGTAISGVSKAASSITTLTARFRGLQQEASHLRLELQRKVEAGGMNGLKKDLSSTIALVERFKAVTQQGVAVGNLAQEDTKGMQGLATMAGQWQTVTKQLEQENAAEAKAASNSSALATAFEKVRNEAIAMQNAFNKRLEVNGIDGLKAKLEDTKRLLAEIRAKAEQGIAIGTSAGVDTSEMKSIVSTTKQWTPVIKQAEAENKALASSMAQVASEASAQAQAEKKIADTTKGTAKAQGDAAKASRQHASSLASLKTSASSASHPIKNLFSSLKRIAKLRLLRGIIRSITGAFKEGKENIYQYSVAIGNIDASHMSATMNEYASTLQYVKNSIGAMIAPILAGLLPAIQTLANWFVIATQAVAQFFAALRGQTTYTRAKKQAAVWGGIADAAGGAAAAAEEYKNTILGFDEIHALNDQNDRGGGGGGGGAAAPNYGDMFEEVPLDTDGIIGAFNKIAKALGPILKTMAGLVADFVSGAVGMFDGFADIVVGALTGDPKKIEQGMNKIQQVLSTNKVWNWIFNAIKDAEAWVTTAAINVQQFVVKCMLGIVQGITAAVNWILRTVWPVYNWINIAIKDVQHWFKIAWLNIKIALTSAAIWILDKFGGLLEKLGILPEGTVDKLKSYFEDTKKGLEKTKKATEDSHKAWKEWAKNREAPQIKLGAEAALKDIIKGLDNQKKEVKRTREVWRDWSNGKIDFKQLQQGLKITSQKATATRDEFKKLAESTKDASKQKYESKNATNGLDKVKDSAGKTKAQIDLFSLGISAIAGKKYDGKAVSTGLDNVKNSSKKAKDEVGLYSKGIDTAKTKKYDGTGVTPGFNSVKDSAGKAKDNVNGASGAVDGISKKKYNGSNIRGGMDSIGAGGKYASDNVWNANNAIGNVIGRGYYNGKNVSDGLWGISGGANGAATNMYLLLDYLRQLTRTDWRVGVQAGLQSGVTDLSELRWDQQKWRFGFAGGGFVPTYKNGGYVEIPAFANGGINSANMFIAHENGAPEMVGRIGNRTAVANTSQMVDAMSRGVYQAMSELMAANNGQTEVNVYMDGRKVAHAVDKANKMQNRRFNVSMA